MTQETRVVRKVAGCVSCRISVATHVKDTIQAIVRTEIKMCVCVGGAFNANVIFYNFQ